MVTKTSIDPPRAVERIWIRDLARRLGERVAVHGWIATKRRAKGIRFVVIRDRTGAVQAVQRGDDDVDFETMNPESAVVATGIVRPCASARFGAIELEAETVAVLGRADAPLPLEGRADAEARLDHRFLDVRAPERHLVFAVRATLLAAMRDHLVARDFLEIQTPKITAGGSESGAAVFELPYFGQSACLIQSPQFYVQLAMAAGLDRVFEIGPVFRAEPAITNRHATEFTCLDVELSWVQSHEELLSLEEGLVRDALSVVRDRHGDEIRRHCGVAVEVPDGPIPRIPIRTAAELTGEPMPPGGRLTHRAEEALSKHARERYGHGFVFITDYPAADRPFYTMRDDGPTATGAEETRSFDLLWRGIEITSGCQREHRHDRLREQARAAGLESRALSRYLETHYFPMFRYGCPPHGGFGIGIERLLMALLAQPSIRETCLVFRGPGRFVP